MRRQLLATVGALGLLATTTGACAITSRQAQADKVIRAAKLALASHALTGTLDASVVALPPRRGTPPNAPRVTPVSVSGVHVHGDPAGGIAALGPDPAAPLLIFAGSAVYQHRIVPAKAASAPPPAAALGAGLATQGAGAASATPAAALAQAAPGPVAPSNLTALLPGATLPTVGRAAARPWVKLDYDRLSRRSTAKTAGSLGISPITMLRLLRGALAGSVRTVPDPEEPGVVHYRFNLSRDKAERSLSDDDRVLLEKVFTANAATKDIQQGEAWVGVDGRLRRAQVTLLQATDDGSRAKLTTRLDLEPVPPGAPAAAVALPAKKETSLVSSLSGLVFAGTPSA